MTQTDQTQYDFDQLIDRRKSDSVKWTRYAPDVLPMWVADMDFVSPAPVLRALHERIEHGVLGYPDDTVSGVKGIATLREAVIARMAERYGWEIGAEDILLIPGVVHGFNLACLSLATSQEAVLIQPPVYPPIYHAAATTHIQQQEAQLQRQVDGSYSIDWEAFDSAVTPQTRLFLLCNPHNPVGKVFGRDELEKAAEICLRKKVVICSDEIHSDLIFPGCQHIPVASIDPEIARNTITLIAPSKTYNIAGLQCSIAIIQDRTLRKRYQDARQGLLPWVNLMGMVAAQAAYQHGGEWLRQLLNYLQANRDYLATFINQNMQGVRMGPVQGTYLAWLDCREAGLEENPYQFFLHKAKVAFNDGETFGPGGQGFVRLNFGCPRSILEQALQRMQLALQMRG